MCRVVIGLLLAFVPQADAGEPDLSHAGEPSANTVYKSVERLLDGVVKRAFPASRHQQTDLDQTALGKVSPDSLGGKVIGNGKYLLKEKPQKSSSGKSTIYRGYRCENGKPVGDKLAIKVSDKPKLMTVESEYYDRFKTGSFINKIDFLPELDVDSGPDKLCALVMECGKADLKDILKERGGQGLEGQALRDAAKAAATCIQAMHSSGFVWTDLKTQNFVMVGSGTGDSGSQQRVKGIDVESVQPCNAEIRDYTPEACPPEFALAIDSGEEEEFILDYSYDVWSYGMYLYELATGKAYFESKYPTDFKILGREVFFDLMSNRGFKVDTSDVKDATLRNLIEQCLVTDPKNRPDISQILSHPYFATGDLQ